MNDYSLRIEYVEYSVKKGDSLYAIAKMFNTTVSELIDINMLTSNTLFPGQILLVPKKNATDSGFDFYIYNTVEGDTIEKISDKENIDPVLLEELEGGFKFFWETANTKEGSSGCIRYYQLSYCHKS